MSQMQTGLSQPLLLGTAAAAAMVVLYFAVVGLISGLDFASTQFKEFWPFLVALAAGFGIQAGLYAYLRKVIAEHAASGTVVAASGTTSAAAMVSCCAHYLVNALPLMGITGLLTFIVHYQIGLFWIGLAFNAAGILYMASRVAKARKEHRAC